MATNNSNDTLPTLLVPVVRSATGVDIPATVEAARKLAEQYARDDQAATTAVIEVTNKILSNEKYANMTSITASTLAKMALGMMGEIPTDKLCTEAEQRVKAHLLGQEDKFVYIARGRNAGFHFRARLDKDVLAKLLKEKATADATAAAKAAGSEKAA